MNQFSSNIMSEIIGLSAIFYLLSNILIKNHLNFKKNSLKILFCNNKLSNTQLIKINIF